MSLILVIDDELEMRLLLRRVLEKEGHQVIDSGNGFDGVKRATKDNPALVITDILMPGMDGIEIIQALRRVNPSPSIIAITGGGRRKSFDYLNAAKALGADAFLDKPFRPAELLQTVRSLLASCSS